ncbi:MAG: undecaprenyl-phosphate glucose phosphotransferase [Proteobacteria bacterium]|nr:undecaprenyl-phosphate glucose phosphotransferase [Pseudomonadota bacterium]
MNPRKQNILTMIRMIVDLFAVCLSWVFAYRMRFYGGIEITRGLPEAALYFKLLPFIAVIWIFIFAASGLYRRSSKHRSAVVEALDILQSCALATVGFIAFTYFYEEYRYSRIVLVIFSVIHPALLILGRSAVRKALRIYRSRATPRRTLIVGAGDFLEMAISMSLLGDVAANDIAGVILEGDPDQIQQGRKICLTRGYKEIPLPRDWANFFVENPMQTVVVALPYNRFSWIEEHLEAIANQVPDVKLLPDLMKFTRMAAGIELISGVPVISIHESPLVGVQGIIKRLIDIVGSIGAIILLSPVMVVIAGLVKLSSKGPVFYRQERMGIDGRTFGMLKFRSMPMNSESTTGAVFATSGDNRATPVGRLLRRSSLDELPQFFNVLSGEMSLVGPRPERPVFVNDFRRKIPGYFLRHKVKAGITGWAQVNGWRGDTSIEKRIECDLYYIQNWSLWLDLKIMILTVVKGFVHKNAY